MLGKRALKKRAQYQSVYRSGTTKLDKLLVIRVLKNQQNYSRLGFSVNKKIGKAVVRNRIKRLLKEITRLIKIRHGFDIIFIARKASAQADYYQLKNTIISLLTKMELLEPNDKKFGA